MIPDILKGLFPVSQALPVPYPNKGDWLLCFDFCAQEQKLPLSLLPSGPGFTENPAQDLPFPDLVTAFARPCASDFSINLILVFAATKLFEKEPLPYPVNLGKDA